MEEYISSLEAAGEVATEEEWRARIEHEKADVLNQNPEAETADTDEVIRRLWEDGYVIDRFEDDAKELLETQPDMSAIAGHMDDDIREDLHSKLAPCKDIDFLKEYMARHYVQFEEMFRI